MLTSSFKIWPSNYFQEHKENYYIFIAVEDIAFNQVTSDLCDDGAWVRDPEITALSEIFKCPIEVYENSEKHRVIQSEDFLVNINTTPN